jgi:hypothetical protein
MFGPSMDQFNLLKSRVDMLEGANQGIMKQLADHDKDIKRLKMNRNNGGAPNQGAGNNLSGELGDELARLREEFEKHRDFAEQNINNLNQ